MSKILNSKWQATTISNRTWCPADPELIIYDLGDIGHALSNICRFGGHCSKFYSVAQHSVLVAEQMPGSILARAALLHDAPEAFLGDMIRSVKCILPHYQGLEKRFWTSIAKQYGLPYKLPELVKLADNRMLVTEKRAFFPLHDRWDVEDEFMPYDLQILPWHPEEAWLNFNLALVKLFPEYARDLQNT
jgi:hypothetical protein